MALLPFHVTILVMQWLSLLPRNDINVFKALSVPSVTARYHGHYRTGGGKKDHHLRRV